MADASFEKTWQMMKSSRDEYHRRMGWPYKPSPEMEEDINAAVDNVIQSKPTKDPETGGPTNSSIRNLLNRVRGVPRDEKKKTERPKGSDTDSLQSETLRRLHQKVRKD